MTELDDARRLLASHFPEAPITWFGCGEHRDRRVDAFLAGPPDEAGFFYVASLRIDGCFVADVVSEYPHIPYDPAFVNAKPPRSCMPGVFVTTWPVHPVRASQARFVHRGATRTAAVQAGHCALFDWETGWLARDDRPAPAALLVDGTWQPAVSSVVAATAEAFRHAYVAYANGHRHGGANWASDAFFRTRTFADTFRMIECILHAPDLSPAGQGFLAAGPVENLISAELLDIIERDACVRARWVPLLGDTYWNSEPPAIRRRLRVLLGLPPEPG